jgi:hypothetical protein
MMNAWVRTCLLATFLTGALVNAIDAPTKEPAGASKDAKAAPSIGWANLQWPHALNHTVGVTNRTENVYGQIWIDGVTSQPGATPNVLAQLGFGPAGSNPQSSSSWVWVDAAFNVDVGNNDEFAAKLLPESAGTYDYIYRYAAAPSGPWVYADTKGLVPPGQAPENPGKLTATAGADRTAPMTPMGLVVAATGPTEIKLGWNKLTGDATLYGYEVWRSGNSGGPYTNIARIETNSYTDVNLKKGSTYYYVVRALDQAFNRSGKSGEVAAVADRSVSVTFNVTVPESTEGTGKAVYIAGTLSQLNGGNLLEWDPGALALSPIDGTHWTITLCGKEGTQLNYKYALSTWDNVEKGRECDEITDRQITLTPGAEAKQAVSDTVLRWRNVAPCGD